MEEKQVLHKTRECGSCVKLFECQGKPENVKRCLNYEERKKRGGAE